MDILGICVSFFSTRNLGILLEFCQVYMVPVLLLWQEFATRSMAVFFDMPPRCRCQCRLRISVCVKARVVKWKQVDVAASRSFLLSWNVLIAHCVRCGCTK